jgi:4-hydroxybenzoate polyprenyltransferase
VWWIGVALVATVLVWEHWLVRDMREDGHSDNINAAFFNANACVGVIVFAAISIDFLLRAN